MKNQQVVFMIIGIGMLILILNYDRYFGKKVVVTADGMRAMDGRCKPYTRPDGTTGYTVYGLEATAQCGGAA